MLCVTVLFFKFCSVKLMLRLKICIVGPKNVGKSCISNYLSGQTPSLIIDNKYEPTAGVRILEYEINSNQGQGQGNINIELWDASGDTSYVIYFNFFHFYRIFFIF